MSWRFSCSRSICIFHLEIKLVHIYISLLGRFHAKSFLKFMKGSKPNLKPDTTDECTQSVPTKQTVDQVIVFFFACVNSFSAYALWPLLQRNYCSNNKYRVCGILHRLVNYRILQNSPVINKRSKPILLFQWHREKKSHPRHQTQKENNSVSFHAITAAYINALCPQKKNR